ncbi:MAG: TlpA family protein disulfide reductase [Actinocrinis sp.]
MVVLALATVAGLAVRHRQGRFRAPTAAALDLDSSALPGSALSAADLGGPLGAQATLVQFSTEVCAYCGPARDLLAEVARERDGIAFVEIDAAQRMDLTRRLHVLATPTVLVLDASGGITSRASGPVRKADLMEALGKTLAQDGLAS